MAVETPLPCAKCGKPLAICVCDRVTATDTRHAVLVLRHPQESDEVLGTARLTELSLRQCTVRTGLSWPSLAGALGRAAEPSRWAVLYPGSLPIELTAAQRSRPVLLLDRAGKELALPATALQGIIVLDGTWAQAKTLWWRNPWLLKPKRIVLHPAEPSAYGRLRAESQKHHLSTIEATAEALHGMGEDPNVRAMLRRLFRTMVQRARDAQAANLAGAPPMPRKHERRRARSSRGGGPLD